MPAEGNFVCPADDAPCFLLDCRIAAHECRIARVMNREGRMLDKALGLLEVFGLRAQRTKLEREYPTRAHHTKRNPEG